MEPTQARPSEWESRSGEPVVLQWVMDTRKLWPEAKVPRDLETVASRCFELLSEPERQSVLRYVFVRDAKHTLGSALLKRFLISRYAKVPWAEATAIREDAMGKPYFVLSDGSEPVAFNISHQDGLVALAAVVGYQGGKIEVGVDVVSCQERRDRDRQTILSEGWDAFVDVYESIFSPADVAALKANNQPSAPVSLEDKLRSFYAYWCAKEAYVKMTGEALLADWIQKLDFRGLKPPRPVMTSNELEFGERVGNMTGSSQFDVLREERKDESVRMEIQSLGSGYMLGVSVRTPETQDDVRTLNLGSFRMFSVNEIEIAGEDMPS